MKLNRVILLGLICAITMLTYPNIGYTESVEIYDLNRAVEMTLKANKDFKTGDIDKMKLGRQLTSIQNNVNGIMSMGGLTQTDKLDQTDALIDSIAALNNSIDNLSDSQALQRETLKDTVKNLFLSIRKLEVQKIQLEKQIILNEQLYSIEQKRLKLGLLSKAELEKKYNELKKQKRQLGAMNTTIEKLYINTKEMMAVPTQVTAKLDFSFISQEKPLPVNKTYTFATLESANLKVHTYRRMVERGESLVTGIKNRYPSGSDSQKDADLDVMKYEVQLKNELNNIVYKYDAAFSQLNDQYNAYVQKESDYNIKDIEFKNTKLRYEIGNASKLELETAKVALEAAKIDLELAQIDYVTSKTALESTVKGTN